MIIAKAGSRLFSNVDKAGFASLRLELKSLSHWEDVTEVKGVMAYFY